MSRRSDKTRTNFLSMRCNKGHGRNRNRPEGACGFKIKSRMDKSGYWRVTEIVNEHNHATRRPQELEEEVLLPRSTESLRPSARKRSRQNSPPSPLPITRHSHTSHINTFLVPNHSPRLSHQLQSQRQPSKLSYNSSPSLNPLFSLVRSFMPHSSSQISVSLAQLASIGIVDTESLALILSLELSIFNRVLSSIADNETKRLLGDMAKELVKNL